MTMRDGNIPLLNVKLPSGFDKVASTKVESGRNRMIDAASMGCPSLSPILPVILCAFVQRQNVVSTIEINNTFILYELFCSCSSKSHG